MNPKRIRFIVLFTALLPFLMAKGQVYQFTANRLFAGDSLRVNDWWIKKFTRNLSSSDSNSQNMIPTSRAVMDAIHQFGGGGGSLPSGNQYNFIDGTKTFSRPLGIIDAREYGCIGDNSTDNTAAFQALFNAVPAGSHVYIPAGRYKISGTITIKKANITIEGTNGNLSYNYSTSVYDSTGTLLIGTSTTANMLVDSASGINLQRLSFLNTATSPAGNGVVLASAGHFFHIDQCRFYGFYNNLEIENGALWNITDCDFWNPINQNIYIHSPTAPDSGDWTITGCNFIGNSTGVTHIRYESSGGGKIIGCKFNDLNGAAGPFIGTCIDLNNAHSTSDFIVSDCSFENFSGKAISLNSPADSFYNIQIHGNQFSTYGTITNVIYATGKVGTISIRNNIFHDAGGNSVYAILLNGVGTTQIENNSWRGWTNKISQGIATTVGGNSRYASSATDDALYFFGNSAAETFGIQNLNASGWSGIDYIDNNGVPRVRSGWSNGNSQEFKIDNIVSGGYTTLYANGSEKMRINSTGVAIGASYYLPPANGTDRYVMTAHTGGNASWDPLSVGNLLQYTSGTLDFKANYMTVTNNILQMKSHFQYWSRTITDADYTFGTHQEGMYILPSVTANRTITVPGFTSTSVDGEEWFLYNGNTSGSFNWLVSPGLKKGSDGTTVTTLTNGVLYHLIGVGGVGYLIVNQ